MVKIIEPSVEILTDIDGDKVLKHIEKCGRTCYQSYQNETEDTTSAKNMIQMLIKMGHESVLEHFLITIKAKIDVGNYKDLTRHRHASFSIESTRFCNYSKGKFGNELTVIQPCNIDKDSGIYHIWIKTMNDIEKAYMDMSALGAKPDQLRMILPHSLAAEVTMSANLREWRHIFKMRCQKAAHPSVRQIMLKTLNEFHNRIPAVFDDLYDEFKEDIENNH